MAEQCGSTLLIRVKPLSERVRITHAVAAAMTVSSGLAIADMGTTYQLQHRRVPFCSRPSYEARRVAVVEQRLLIGAQSLSGMVRMVEAVLVALQANCKSSDSVLGNGTELQHRRVLSRLRGCYQ